MKSNSDVTRKSNSSSLGQSGSGQSGSGQSGSGQSGNGYAPSVPITVYRELAAELQATKAMMESMNAQSQHLVRQNQLLKQEIERLVHSALTLQQIAGISQTTATTASPTLLGSIPASHVAASHVTSEHVPASQSPGSNPEAIASWVRQSTRPAQPRPERPAERPAEPSTAPSAIPSAQFSPLEFDPAKDDLFSEIAEEPHRPEKRPAPKNMSGFWLTATIAVIVITAFGAGFLVVRPLLPGR